MSPETSRAQLSLVKSYELLLELVDNLDAMVAYWDRDRICVFANEAYRDWFGVTRRDLIGKTMEELLGPLHALNLPYIEAAYAGEVQVFERAIPTPEGDVRASLATYTPRFVDGQVQGIFVHVADVSPLKELEHELRAAKAEAERRATHDFLTGLPNRVMLEDRMKQALAASKRSGKRVAFIAADLDDFKKVNDTYGHAAGDQLLIQVGSRLRQSLREHDTATRMGGDEFLVLCPEIGSVSEAEAVARRIMRAVREPFPVGGTDVSIGCCLGIALGTPGGSSPEAMLVASDDALYQAKRSGKNRFALAEADGRR